MKKYIIICGESACYPTILHYERKEQRDSMYDTYLENPKDYDMQRGKVVEFSYIAKCTVNGFKRF